MFVGLFLIRPITGRNGSALTCITAIPSPEAQLTFLSKLQRLFAEGDFTATYKYALLIAFADLAVELGADDGRELVLTTRQLGERFIHLYWRQATPYGTGRQDALSGVLAQNKGAQATVVKAIENFRSRFAVASPQVAKTLPEFKAVLLTVMQTVSAQPLNYLQNFGGGTDEFLYERVGPGKVRLKPGIMYCLRRFQPLVQQLARSHWIGHVKANRRNHAILGDNDDLESFLFATSRQSLALLVDELKKVDGSKCFYCGYSLGAVDVDHFIPFSQYPRDLAHNFVLAHPGCNRSKSDTLAARPHLARWIERLTMRADDIKTIAFDVGMVGDAMISTRIANWAYTGAIQSESRAWFSPNKYEVVDSSYSMLF